MAEKEWEKPQIKEVELETDEDVLRQCFSASAPGPFQGECGVAIDCPSDG